MWMGVAHSPCGELRKPVRAWTVCVRACTGSMHMLCVLLCGSIQRGVVSCVHLVLLIEESHTRKYEVRVMLKLFPNIINHIRRNPHFSKQELEQNWLYQPLWFGKVTWNNLFSTRPGTGQTLSKHQFRDWFSCFAVAALRCPNCKHQLCWLAS